MREIKYRAFYDNMMFGVACINMYYGNVVLLAVNEEQEKYISTINKKAMINCKNMLSVEISKVIIQQYTGLKDKNGTEIYEGDIIRFDEELSVVRYDEETARFVLDGYGIRGCLMEYGWDESAGGFGIVDTNGFDDFNDISEIEVIGNIYENPELLEGRV